MAREKKVRLGLGDAVEAALSFVGITPDRVKKLIGKDCGCQKRKEWMNRIRLWGKQAVKDGDKDEATKYFEQMEQEKAEEKK